MEKQKIEEIKILEDKIIEKIDGIQNEAIQRFIDLEQKLRSNE